MSGVSDKARFYLEQAIPQLREFEEKKIFSPVRPTFSSSSHTVRPRIDVSLGRDQNTSKEEVRF
jgi:hypothetical protein